MKKINPEILWNKIKTSTFAQNIQRYDVICILASLPISMDRLLFHYVLVWILVYFDVLRIYRTTLVNRRCCRIFRQDQQEFRSRRSAIQKTVWAGRRRGHLSKTSWRKTSKPWTPPLIRQFSFRERLHSERNNIYI